MGTQTITSPVSIQVFTDNTIDSYIADDRELFIDKRNGSPIMRVGDGVTPGGQPAFPDVVGGIATPTILTPADGSTGIVTAPVITADSMLGIKPDGTAETHDGTYWEISTVANFGSIYWQSNLDTNNLTSIDLSAAGITLDKSTVYYVRVRYVSASGTSSEWSPITSFTTELGFNGIELTQIFPGDPQTSGFFGHRVTISSDGTLALVGSFGYDHSGLNNAGKVYVYDIDPVTGIWTEQRQITASDAQAGAGFGMSVCISDDKYIAVVGAAGHTTSSYTASGKVYVYDIDPTTGAWTEQRQITASDIQAQAYFGISATISNDKSMVLIGSHTYNHSGLTDAGKVYVYGIDPVTGYWTEQQQITASDAQVNGNFGASVCLSSDKTLAIIGSIGFNTSGLTEAGKVYVYNINTTTNAWTIAQMEGSSSPQINGRFGMSISVSDDKSLIAIGAEKHDVTGTSNAGLVYIYDADPLNPAAAWSERLQLAASDPQVNGGFGYSLSFLPDKSKLLVGSGIYDYSGLVDAGKVYVFK